MKHSIYDFLPVSRDDMISRGYYYYDFLLITGDAYVDHQSFGAAVIGRVLESHGYRVAILAQPRFDSACDIIKMGRPRYAALVTAGNLDSMVAHYTAAKKRRSEDYYTPGKKSEKRPDRAVIVYSKLVREAYDDLPIIIGGIEASLRRFSHYDYWDDKVRVPILCDSGADMLVYGMGEKAIVEIARRLSKKEKIDTITDVKGTAYLRAYCNTDTAKMSEAQDDDACVVCPSYEEVSKDKKAYAKATKIQHEEHDPFVGKKVLQKCGSVLLTVNPPRTPYTTEQLDSIYELDFTRQAHPMYDSAGGVPAIAEVQFSIIHNRGCFGGCNFCSLSFHQGRVVSSRSHESVIREAEKIVGHSGFKGHIHDIGGPTANFRKPSCKRQAEKGLCKGKNCLVPPCENLEVDHSDYLSLLRKLTSIKGVKKVFIRSGLRFDYLMYDDCGEFFAELVKSHISGQLKVAPEHSENKVLTCMGKPGFSVFEKFEKKFSRLNAKYEKRQFLVPYLMSSHPGSTLDDAISLAIYLKKTGRNPQQVQDFYPTPGTISTCMYYTGIDPLTMKSVYVPRSTKERAEQRALLQWRNRKNHKIIYGALKRAGREDLIGYGKNCLIKPK